MDLSGTIFGLDPAALAFGAGGLVWGLISDRVAARWPLHEDGRTRRLDWRTPVVAVVAALAFAALPGRFDQPTPLAIFSGYFVVLTLLFATDLDQRLLPDLLTLPLIPLAALLLLSGLNPLVLGREAGAVAAAFVVPACLFVFSIPFGKGAIGAGDLKLLVSVGLVSGLLRAAVGVVVGVLVAGVVILALVVLRRITLHSYVPYGPFLIIGAFWAVIVGL